MITQAGLTAVTVGGDRDPWRLLEANPGWLHAGRVTLTPPYDAADDPAKVDWDHPLAGYRESVTWRHKPINVPMVNDVVAYARHWKPRPGDLGAAHLRGRHRRQSRSAPRTPASCGAWTSSA